MIKKTLKRLFNQYGYDIIRKGQSFSMGDALHRCKVRGLTVNSVIDVGASDGRWSDLCMNYFPNAKYFLIEAQECHKSGLDLFVKNHYNAEYVLAAAGKKTGKMFFNNSDPLGGCASEISFPSNNIEVPVTTIDNEVANRHMNPPFLIKLDTHGYEVPILEGALKTLEKTNLVILETYNYKLNSNSLRYFEISQYMENLGFSSIEMVDLLLRKKDNSLWQMDTFYIPSNSMEFSYSFYE